MFMCCNWKCIYIPHVFLCSNVRGGNDGDDGDDDDDDDDDDDGYDNDDDDGDGLFHIWSYHMDILMG